MSGHKLFFGLITHRGSRFNDAGQAALAVSDLAARLEQEGVEITFLVSDRDDYSPDTFPITRRLLFSSAISQAWIEFRWRRYLATGRGDFVSSLPRDSLVLPLMACSRLHSYLGWNLFRPAIRMPGAEPVVRLLNIDLSHLRVYKEALDSGCESIVVIEDDARALDPETVSLTLLDLIRRNTCGEASFINLSESISKEALGVVGILGDSDPDQPSVTTCSRPVTNTVCANLFNREFVLELFRDMMNRGLTPVIPIDWRVNRFIMRAWKMGFLNGHTCTWVEPGVFIQGSMHATD